MANIEKRDETGGGDGCLSIVVIVILFFAFWGFMYGVESNARLNKMGAPQVEFKEMFQKGR